MPYAARAMSRRIRSLFLAGLASVSFGAWADEEPSTAKLPDQPLTRQILYQFLLAEIAGGRGQLNLASSAYVDLAKSTQDPRIARRAAEVALHARQLEPALEASRIWYAADPESPPARQALWSLLAATHHSDELADRLAKVLEQEGPSLPAALLQLNRLLARYPDRPSALALINRVTSPYLNLPEAHFARAQAAQAAQDDPQALAEAETALQQRPDWEPAALLKAQLLINTPVQAADFLKQFLDRNPKAAEARLARARLLIDAKRYDDARKAFAELLAAQPDNLEMVYAVGLLSLQVDDPVTAERQLRRLLGSAYADQDSVRFYLGTIAEDRRRFDEALSLYAEVTPGTPRYLMAQARSASVLRQLNRLPEARERLHEAVVASPDDRTQLQLVEAQLLTEAGQPTEAFGVLQAGVQAHPDDPVLLYEAAMTADKAGRFDVMEKHLRHLIQVKPDHAHAYNALGYSMVERNERLDEAQKLIDKALSLAPDDPFILDSKGWVFFRRGRHADAETYLRKAFTLRPDPEIAAHLGEVLWVQGRRDEARKTWDDALKAAPANEVLTTTVKRLAP